MINDNIKLPFGIRLGEIVHISEVQSGLDCECTCLNCGGALVARKGPKNTHHFSHYVDSSCNGGLESTLHLFAKRVISTVGYLKTPSFTVKVPSDREYLYETQPSRVIYFNKVEIEKRLDDKLWRYDLVGYYAGKRLLIEVSVHHKTSGRKLDEAVERRESMIEIRLDPKSIFSLSYVELAAMITDNLDNKVWLSNEDEFEIKNRLIELNYSRKQKRSAVLGKFKLQFMHEDKTHQSKFINSERLIAHKVTLLKLQAELGSNFINPSFPRLKECQSQEEYVINIHTFFSNSPYSGDEAYNFFMLMREYISDSDLDLAVKMGLCFFE